MLTASNLINHLDYAAPKQTPVRRWFSLYALILSGILCSAFLIIVMLMFPLAHAIYSDFALEDTSISAGLWAVSRWLARYHRWVFLFIVPVLISLAAGLRSREPGEKQDIESALVLSVPAACIILTGAFLITAIPFIRFHQLLQQSADGRRFVNASSPTAVIAEESAAGN